MTLMTPWASILPLNDNLCLVIGSIISLKALNKMDKTPVGESETLDMLTTSTIGTLYTGAAGIDGVGLIGLPVLSYIMGESEIMPLLNEIKTNQGRLDQGLPIKEAKKLFDTRSMWEKLKSEDYKFWGKPDFAKWIRDTLMGLRASQKCVCTFNKVKIDKTSFTLSPIKTSC